MRRRRRRPIAARKLWQKVGGKGAKNRRQSESLEVVRTEVVKQTVNLTVASSKSLLGSRHAAASRTDDSSRSPFLLPKFN